MGHKDDGKPSFGPGHDGWHCVVPYIPGRGPTLSSRKIFKKAKSAYAAAAMAGFSLTECAVRAITKDNHPDVLEALETNQPRQGWEL